MDPIYNRNRQPQTADNPVASGSAAERGSAAALPDKGDGTDDLTETHPRVNDTPEKCVGEERWNVKVGTDAAAGGVALDSIVDTTIASLRALPKPPHVPNDLPRQVGPEQSVYRLTDVQVTDYRIEGGGKGDQDFHIVVSDGHDTMVVEVPDPDCMGASPWRTRVESVRDQVQRQLRPIESWQTANATRVTLVGVAFFDKLHGQRGHAPNGIELHPLLGICFGAGCSVGPAQSTAAAAAVDSLPADAGPSHQVFDVPTSPGPTCTRGCPCGNACISCDKVCHVESGSAHRRHR